MFAAVADAANPRARACTGTTIERRGE